MLDTASSLLGSLYSKYFWITAVVVGVYAYLKFFVYTYWERRGVAQDNPRTLFSNALPAAFGKISLGNYFKDIYEKYVKHRFIGIYMFYQPVLMINDPDLIRDVLVKDFNKFRDRGMYHNETVDPLTSNLFFVPGEEWKRLRAILSPTFTSKKLKEMFFLLTEISDELLKTADAQVDKSDIIDAKDLIARYTTDSISSIMYGYNCNSLSDPESEFSRCGAFAFDHAPIKNFLLAFANDILHVIRQPGINQQSASFFQRIFDEMVENRRKNNIVRKDFMNLLMQLVDNGMLDDSDESVAEQDKLSIVQARGQAYIFFLAGFETSSSTMTYLLYELALNPEIQEKLHQELDDFFFKRRNDLRPNQGRAQISRHETLRKHSSFGFIHRKSVEDWQIPDTNVTIEKGTSILISVSGIHRNPEIYPDPDKFDPNRFTEEKVAERSPYVYLAFGRGPRNCIGARFGIIQSKIALTVLLKNYKISKCDRTIFPLPYSTRSYLQTPGSVYLRFERRL